MPAREPEELDKLFVEALNAGDLDALVALYEPGASLTAAPAPGNVVTGTQAIREALSAFLGMKPRLTLEVKALSQAGDIALTSARYHLTGTRPDGNPIDMSGQTAEVARRQPDGTWRFVIDTPFGLGWDE